MKIRSAAALASAGLIALAVPGVAAAAPSAGSLGSLTSSSVQDEPTEGPTSGDDSVGCTIDWNTVSNYTFDADDASNKGWETKVSPDLGSPGISELHHWGTSSETHWRSVVATDRAIEDFSLTVTLPEGYEYDVDEVSVQDDSSSWFWSWYTDSHPDATENPWKQQLGGDQLAIKLTAPSTFTVTAKDGTLPAHSNFVITYTGTDGQIEDDTITGTQHVTGTAVANPGDLPFCSSDIGGVISGSLGSGPLGSLSAS